MQNHIKIIAWEKFLLQCYAVEKSAFRKVPLWKLPLRKTPHWENSPLGKTPPWGKKLLAGKTKEKHLLSAVSANFRLSTHRVCWHSIKSIWFLSLFLTDPQHRKKPPTYLLPTFAGREYVNKISRYMLNK